MELLLLVGFALVLGGLIVYSVMRARLATLVEAHRDEVKQLTKIVDSLHSRDLT